MANLTQLRMLERLDGILLVDKPAGLAYPTVVKTVKRKFGLVKVGHGGSLDPAASGLLVLLVGESNKFAADVMSADRAWEGTFRLGVRTDTGDVQGRAGESSNSDWAKVLEAARLEKAVREFRGDVFQTEPRFCSVRREGTGAYEVADTGDHAPFLAHVYRFEVTVPADPAPSPTLALPFSLVASKGVLVRALADDFGAFLGCGAALETCRRTRVGSLSVADAVPFDRLLETETGDFAALVKPFRTTFHA